MKKRILSGLLALCIVLTLLPTAALAEEPEAAGEFETPTEAEASAEQGEPPAELEEGPEPSERGASQEVTADGGAFYALETVRPGEAAALAAAGARGNSTDVAYTVEGGNIYSDPETGTVTDCDHDVTRADIPSSVGGIKVTVIGTYAFYSCDILTSVTIPDSIKSIGREAFTLCGGLTEIMIDSKNKYYASVNGVLFNKDKEIPNLLSKREG